MNRNLFKSLSPGKILFYIIAPALLWSCSGKESQDQKTEIVQPEAVVREVFPAEKGRLSSSLRIPGELIAYQQVDLYAKENSFVKKVYVDVGSEVNTGTILVSMEEPE